MTRAIIAAALAIFTVVPVTHAATDTSKQVVTYGDLDLNTTAGRTELNSRVRAAAGNLCSPVLAWPVDSEPSIHQHKILYDACVGRLTNRAMSRIDSASHPGPDYPRR